MFHSFVFCQTAKDGTIPHMQKHEGSATVPLTGPKRGVFSLQLAFKSKLWGKTSWEASNVAINAQPVARATNMQYLAAVSLLAVFLINILTPPDFVIDILYVCSIVLVFRQNTKTILRFSIAACILIVINALFFDVVAGHHISLWINRLISLIAIGITSYIAIRYRRQTKVSTQKQQQYVIALEAMLFMISHEVRKPVANILGLVEAIHTNGAELSGADIQELSTYLRYSATELDTLITSLNTFMEQTQKEHQETAGHSPAASWSA
jgi:signal transduction histidine kinase